ncbi:hypothetical protein [Haloferax elongans]|nr:hypothetical protein [Haloferax elongans]
MQYYLRELGYEPTYREGEWFITSTATRDLFGYIGGPVPGMEHKWALDRETYDAIRDEHREELERLSHWTDEPKVELSLYRPGTHQPEIPSAEPLLAQSDPGKQFSRVDCLRAIRKAGELVSEPLTTTVYERVRPLMVDAPSTSLISERFGWRELLFEAAGRPEGNKAKWSEWECAAAIAQFAAQTEQPWTIVKYNAFISDCEQRYPAAHTIVQRYGGWIAALKHLAAAGILHEELDQVRRHQQKWPDTEIKAAIREALEDQEDNTLVGEDYDEWRSRQPSPRPSRRTIIRRYGRWSDAVRLVGGNPGRQDDE